MGLRRSVGGKGEKKLTSGEKKLARVEKKLTVSTDDPKIEIYAQELRFAKFFGFGEMKNLSHT